MGSIASGARLGPYLITQAIGAGGMGEVYRARDTRLERDVAIKILPNEVAHDPDRRARFEREARAVAALSHPNILAIHDVGSHDGMAYAVTELLEGETLRQRLGGGAMPPRKGRRDRHPDRQWSRGRAREKHRAPRSQAGKRLHHP